MLDNKSRVSHTPMCYILVLPCRHVHVGIFLEDKDKMIQRMKIIRYICGLTCASFHPNLRTSGSDLGWALVFEIGFSVDIVLEAPIGYPIGYSINLLLSFSLDNSFVTWEVYLVGVSLGILTGLMIGTVEGSLVVLSL